MTHVSPFLAFLFFGHKTLEEIFETTGKTLISKDYELNEYGYAVFFLAYLYLFYIIGKTMYSFISFCLKHENKQYMTKEEINQVKDELADIADVTQELVNDLNSGFNSTRLSISQLKQEIKKIVSDEELEEIKEVMRKDIDRVTYCQNSLVDIWKELGKTETSLDQRTIRRIRRSICSVTNKLDLVGSDKVTEWLEYDNDEENDDPDESDAEEEIDMESD